MKYLINIVRIVFFVLFFFLLAKGKVILWLGIYGISLIAALIFGRIYCGYICPMNTLMIPVEWISKKLKLQTKKSPQWLKNGYFTWIAFLGSVAIMMLGKRILHKNIPILPIWLVIAALVTLKYHPYVFHNLLCPFSPLQRIFSRFARLGERVNKDTCIGCKRCEKVCPSNAVAVLTDKKAEINTALCFQCTNCSQICPENSIRYESQKNKGFEVQ